MRHWPVTLIVVLLAVLLGPGGHAAAEAEDQLPVLVTGVADGDTLTVRLADGRSDTLRLIGIDAPEGDAPNRPAGCFARESTARTSELALNRAGIVELDTRDRDRAGRLLGYLHLEGQTRSLNEQLLAEGFALPLSVGSNTAYSDDLRAAARAAQLRSTGIWSACDVADLPTIATAYPLDETPALWATEPAIRLLLGTQRDEGGTLLTVTVEARGAGGLNEIAVSGDRQDDPVFSSERTLTCGGQATCSDTWTARPRGLGTYQLHARVSGTDGQTADTQAGLRIVGRWQMIAARAAQVRERATEVRPPAPAPTPSVPINQTECSAGFPVKALRPDESGVRRYLLPADGGYAEAVPQGCFQTEADASAAGWTR
jgi:endonuclease YncB( thermonuclease family)